MIFQRRTTGSGYSAQIWCLSVDVPFFFFFFLNRRCKNILDYSATASEFEALKCINNALLTRMLFGSEEPTLYP